MTLEPALGYGTNEAAVGGEVDVGRGGMLLRDKVSRVPRYEAEIQKRSNLPNGGQCMIQDLHREEAKALNHQDGTCGTSVSGRRSPELSYTQCKPPKATTKSIQEKCCYNKVKKLSPRNSI